MVEIIEENRQPTGIERFMQMLSSGVRGAAEGGQALKEAMNSRSDRETLSNQFGEKFRNIRDPKLQQLMFQGEIEKQKLSGKEALQDQKLKFLENLFSGNATSQEKSNEPNEPLDDVKNQDSFDPSSLSDQQIAAATAIDPNIGRNLQHAKDVALRERREEEKLNFKKQQAGKQENESAYKVQKPFIDDVTNAYKSFVVDTKPRLMQMQTMDPEKLISPTASVFLDALGIPLGALEDPHSELYQKVSQDLLKGLPETYGNRILKVEVENFLKTIPTLMNSPEGRRMIASNMLKLGEMKEVYYNAMRQMQQDYLDKNKPLPKDFEQRIFDQVLPQINRINQEFVKLSQISAVPPGHIPFFTPSGEIKFVPKDKEQWAIENQGRRIW